LVINGRYTWRVQMPILVKFTGASGETQRHFVVTMNVQRTNTLDTAQGIRIIDFVAVSLD